MTNTTTAQERFAQFASQMARNPHTLAQLREAMDDAERRGEISARIKALRERKGYTQPQVARKVGVEVRTYQNWEAGGGTSHDNYERLAEVLEASYDYLLTGGDLAPPAKDILSRLDGLEAAVHDLRGEIAGSRTELLAELAKAQASQEAQPSRRQRGGRSSAGSEK